MSSVTHDTAQSWNVLFKKKTLTRTSFHLHAHFWWPFVFIWEVQCYVSVYVFVGSWSIHYKYPQILIIALWWVYSNSFLFIIMKICTIPISVTNPLLFIGQILFFLWVSGTWQGTASSHCSSHSLHTLTTTTLSSMRSTCLDLTHEWDWATFVLRHLASRHLISDLHSLL